MLEILRKLISKISLRKPINMFKVKTFESLFSHPLGVIKAYKLISWLSSNSSVILYHMLD